MNCFPDWSPALISLEGSVFAAATASAVILFIKAMVIFCHKTLWDVKNAESQQGKIQDEEHFGRCEKRLARWIAELKIEML